MTRPPSVDRPRSSRSPSLAAPAPRLAPCAHAAVCGLPPSAHVSVRRQPPSSSPADTYKRSRCPRCEARGFPSPTHRTSRPLACAHRIAIARSAARCPSPSPLPRPARRLHTHTASHATPPRPRCSRRHSRTPLQAPRPLAFCRNASAHIICFPAIGVGSRRRARRPSPPSNPPPPPTPAAATTCRSPCRAHRLACESAPEVRARLEQGC
ncbi:hypothetical protein B0H15DRAFT_1023524, partial [Mycena belliarum]